MDKVWIVAEIGINHNGRLSLAKELIDVACEAGVDCVKFQTFKTDLLVTRAAPKAPYQETAGISQETQFEMLHRCEFSENDQEHLLAYCQQKEIEFMSTPFDLESLEFLVQHLKVKRIKIASGEITHAPLLLRAAQLDKPIILSTGMSSLGEIETALGFLALGYMHVSHLPTRENREHAYGSTEGQSLLKKNVSLLQCTSQYPTPYGEVNLRAMDTLSQTFGLPVGFSDHTLGIEVAIAAVARGARIIEKHVTLDKRLEGPDHRASLDPQELKQLVKSIRSVEAALGAPQKMATREEQKNKAVIRKGIVAKRAIQGNEVFTVENLTCKRPAQGISPILFWELLGQRAKRAYDPDEPIETPEG